MFGRLIRDFRQLHRALKRFYRKRSCRPLTPEQEVARIIAELNRQQEMARRLTGRR